MNTLEALTDRKRGGNVPVALSPIQREGRATSPSSGSRPDYYEKTPEELARDIARVAASLHETQPQMTLAALFRRIRAVCRAHAKT